MLARIVPAPQTRCRQSDRRYVLGLVVNLVQLIIRCSRRMRGPSIPDLADDVLEASHSSERIPENGLKFNWRQVVDRDQNNQQRDSNAEAPPDQLLLNR